MGMVGCYTLDLYCDHADHRWNPGPAVYTGRTEAECVREARRDGWRINRKGQGKKCGCGRGACFCPEHSGNRTPLRKDHE